MDLSLFRCHCAWCAAVCSRVYQEMIVQFHSVWLVRKSTQMTMHQEHKFLILHWTKQQSPVLDIHKSREIDQRNTVCKCAFPRHWVANRVSVRISRDVFYGIVQVIRFQCKCRQVVIQFSSSFQASKHFLSTYKISKCW